MTGRSSHSSACRCHSGCHAACCSSLHPARVDQRTLWLVLKARQPPARMHEIVFRRGRTPTALLRAWMKPRLLEVIKLPIVVLDGEKIYISLSKVTESLKSKRTRWHCQMRWERGPMIHVVWPPLTWQKELKWSGQLNLWGPPPLK